MAALSQSGMSSPLGRPASCGVSPGEGVGVGAEEVGRVGGMTRWGEAVGKLVVGNSAPPKDWM